MKKKKSNFSNKYFEKKFNKRKNKNRNEALYYSTEIRVTEYDNLKCMPEINICVFSIDDPNNQKEIDKYSYQKYLKYNYSSKKEGDANE